MSEWSNPRCGIYCLVFPSGHYYFGQSKRIRFRHAEHLSKLRRQVHNNKWMMAIYRTHGLPAVRIECLCDEADLNTAEQMYLDEHFGKPMCLNLVHDADCPARGRKVSAEEREAKRQLMKTKWADGTNALLRCIGMNTPNLLAPENRAKALAIRRTPENRAMQAVIRTQLHQEPAFKAAHSAGVVRHFSNEQQQHARLEALHARHQDPAFTERRLALTRAVCQKAVECVETGRTWESAVAWQKWIKEEYGLVVNTSWLRKHQPYKGQTYRYMNEHGT